MTGAGDVAVFFVAYGEDDPPGYEPEFGPGDLLVVQGRAEGDGLLVRRFGGLRVTDLVSA